LEEIKHRSLGGMVSFGHQITRSALLVHMLKASEATAELKPTEFGGLSGQLTKTLQFRPIEA
jgi:hypothetical protein